MTDQEIQELLERMKREPAVGVIIEECPSLDFVSLRRQLDTILLLITVGCDPSKPIEIPIGLLAQLMCELVRWRMQYGTENKTVH